MKRHAVYKRNHRCYNRKSGTRVKCPKYLRK